MSIKTVVMTVEGFEGFSKEAGFVLTEQESRELRDARLLGDDLRVTLGYDAGQRYLMEASRCATY